MDLAVWLATITRRKVLVGNKYAMFLATDTLPTIIMVLPKMEGLPSARLNVLKTGEGS